MNRLFLVLICVAGSIHFSLAEEVAPSLSAPRDSVEQPVAPPAPRDTRVPLFQMVRPQWGIQFSSTLNAFGRTILIRDQGDTPFYAFSILGEYQPAFLQRFGVFGFGPSVSLYPIFNSNVTSNVASLVSVGGQVRYQARYFREQPVVPVVAYSLEYLNYQFTNGSSGNAWMSGPVFGIWILLNFLEPSSAAQFYVDNGVNRSYFILEARNLSGRSSKGSYYGDSIRMSGYSYYFGLRFEF